MERWPLDTEGLWQVIFDPAPGADMEIHQR